MFISAVGHSEDPDTIGAAEDIRKQCEERLAGISPTAGILFAAIDFDHQELLDSFNSFWSDLELIGSTTDGEVSSELGFMEDSVVLILFASDTIDITTGVGRQVSQDIGKACRDAVEMARSRTTKEPALAVTTPESLTTSGQQIVEALVSELGKGVPLVGGTAGDQFRMKETFQFIGNEVLSDSVPLLLFSGPLAYSFSVGSGMKQIGNEGIVTKSEGNLIQEIDSAPAADFYKKMMGSTTISATETPLAVLNEDGDIDYLRAAAGDFDPQTGELSMFADTREGSRVQIAISSRDSIVESCGQASHVARDRFPAGTEPGAVFIFSCAARKVLLGSRTEEEYQTLAEVLDTSVPCAGFYTYGEICPSVSLEEGAKFHNNTFVTAILGERSE